MPRQRRMPTPAVIRAIAPAAMLAMTIAAAGLLVSARPAHAQQFTATRLAILQAEDTRAATPIELARLRAGVLSGDPQTMRLAVRALGRLERPAVIADILPGLSSRFSEVRSEAANAIAQSAAGWRHGLTGGPAIASLLQTLRARLAIEDDSGVRGVLIEAIARLPYTDSAMLSSIEALLQDYGGRHGDVADRLGLAKAYEAFVRNKAVTLTAASISLLKSLTVAGAIVPAPAVDSPTLVPAPTSGGGAPSSFPPATTSSGPSPVAATGSLRQVPSASLRRPAAAATR